MRLALARDALARDIGIQRFQTMYLATLPQRSKRPIHGWRRNFRICFLQTVKQRIRRMRALTIAQNGKDFRLHLLSTLTHTVLHSDSMR